VLQDITPGRQGGRLLGLQAHAPQHEATGFTESTGQLIREAGFPDSRLAHHEDGLAAPGPDQTLPFGEDGELVIASHENRADRGEYLAHSLSADGRQPRRAQARGRCRM